MTFLLGLLVGLLVGGGVASLFWMILLAAGAAEETHAKKVATEERRQARKRKLKPVDPLRNLKDQLDEMSTKKPEDPTATRGACGLKECRIQKPHSHVGDLARRVKG